MDDLSERLLRLGSAVADVSDRVADQEGAAAARARKAIVSGTPAVPTSGRVSAWRSGWRAPVLAAAACIALAGAGWRIAAPAPPRVSARPLTFSVEAEQPGVPAVPGVVGEWVAAGAAVPREASFSDGSELKLSPGARMRVTTTSPTGADVLIERGLVHVAVAHAVAPTSATKLAASPDPPVRWAVRAGPFEVRVTGTTFDAAWDPIAEKFELTMIEGRVLVTGPNLPPERAVVGGERLVVSMRDGKMVLSTIPASTSDGALAPTASAAVEASPSSAPSAAPDRAVAGVVGAKPPDPQAARWKDLAASGKYRDAFAAAEAAGFSQEVERAPAGDLLMLADAARFAGSPARAREALLAARRRFGVRGQSAFLLGKIAADQQGSPGDAVVWFETYLREQPGGPLAEQALGRVVDLTRRSSPDAARQAAARYLARYPEGSYAALARSLTSSPPP